MYPVFNLINEFQVTALAGTGVLIQTFFLKVVLSFCEMKKSVKFAVPLCGNSSVGRARPCQGRGREFESRFPLKNVIFDP